MEGNKENKERYGVIYKITNTVNGKCYIGQTVNSFNGRYSFSGEGIERVYNHHKYYKEHNRRYNDHLLRSIEKYGFEAFDVVKEFDIGYSREELNDLERKYIKEFDCINNGYNHKEGGSDGKYPEEVCKKISESLKGKFAGENNPMYGKHRTEEQKRKQSETLKGKYCGENHPMYGKHRTEEERRKISESLKGKYCGENSPNYGRRFSEEHRRKISGRIKGKLVGENNPMYGVHRYGENSPNKRKVICLNDNNIFNTLKECIEYYKINVSTLIRICKGETKKSRTGLRFMYYDEYIQQQKQQDQAVI